MSEVTVTINGRSYKMACDDGQEKHLLSLADHVNQHVEHLTVRFGQVGDARLLLMASIMVTDELVEMRRYIDSMEIEIQRVREAHENAARQLQDMQYSTARVINTAAARVESLTGRLNRGEGLSESDA